MFCLKVWNIYLTYLIKSVQRELDMKSPKHIPSGPTYSGDWRRRVNRAPKTSTEAEADRAGWEFLPAVIPTLLTTSRWLFFISQSSLWSSSALAFPGICSHAVMPFLFGPQWIGQPPSCPFMELHTYQLILRQPYFSSAVQTLVLNSTLLIKGSEKMQGS